jgi:polysaccharide biosynthesis transport protein
MRSGREGSAPELRRGHIVRIPDLYRAVWRHRLFVIAMTILTVAAVWVVTSKQQKLYTASTLIRVEQNANNPTDVINSLEAGQRLAQTYARISETRTIRNQIYEQLHGTVGLHRIDISATPVQDLELLTISATHPSPRLARKVANAAPEALRSFVQRTGTPHEQIIVLENARLPTSPSSPRLKLNLAIALVLGLVLNGFLALLGEIVRDRLPEGSQLEELLGRPVLAAVPTLEFIHPKRGGAGLLRRKQGPTPTIDREVARASSLTARVGGKQRPSQQPRLQSPAPKSERARR